MKKFLTKEETENLLSLNNRSLIPHYIASPGQRWDDYNHEMLTWCNYRYGIKTDYDEYRVFSVGDLIDFVSNEYALIFNCVLELQNWNYVSCQNDDNELIDILYKFIIEKENGKIE